MAISSPHIYLSALSFALTSSPIYMHYCSSFPRILHMECGQLSHWPSLEMEIYVGDSVTSIALSPNGQCIVSSTASSVYVWDVTTGEMIAGPFTGHKSVVTSVAFSPDGQYIVSGSWDETICVWNSITGEMVAGPFTGHKNSVTSVAFSPDGQHIVSGSFDKTIQMLNFSNLTRKTETKKDIDFTDDSQVNAEGWICGKNGELLMWILPTHRECLHYPSTIWWASCEHQTRLDLSNFVHGHSWATCIDPNSKITAPQ